MSDTAEDLEIEIDDDKPNDLPVDVVTDDKPPEVAKPEDKPVITPDDGIAALRRQVDAEKAARLAAEQRAHMSEQQIRAAKTEVEDVNLTLVKQAIDSVGRDRQIARDNYRNAMAAGDYDAAADAQMLMSDAAARLSQLEAGKAAMEARAKAPPRQERQITSDPVEALAAQLTPKSAAWVRDHPEYARDPRLNAKMVAAHQFVMADGAASESDDYFQRVESILGIRKAAAAPAAEPAPERPVSRQPPAAPVSRAGTMNGTRPNVVRLTSAEREIAAMNGMTDKEYALNKLALIKDGRLN